MPSIRQTFTIVYHFGRAGLFKRDAKNNSLHSERIETFLQRRQSKIPTCCKKRMDPSILDPRRIHDIFDLAPIRYL